MAGTQVANQTVRYDTGNVTLAANNDFIVLNTLGFDCVGIQVLTGLTGSVTYSGSNDGVNFITMPGFSIAGNANASSTDVNPTGVLRYFDTTGIQFLRAQITAYTSGSCVVNWLCENTAPSMVSLSVGNVLPGTSATALGKAEDGPATTGDVGVAALGVRVDSSTASTTSANGDYSQISTDNIGAVRVVGSMGANGSTGHTQFRLASAASTNATSVKATAGCVYAISVANSNAAVRYLKFYNKATAPTVGTDTPVLVIAVPPTNTLFLEMALTPLPCSAGIALATTTGATDADATAVGAADLLITLLYA